MGMNKRIRNDVFIQYFLRILSRIYLKLIILKCGTWIMDYLSLADFFLSLVSASAKLTEA